MIYLVGAGPGSAGLITYRGMELLKSCDAVIYDRLGTCELLNYIRPDCERIYVGKRAGEHYRRQEEINAILEEADKKYDLVVRLKGGDPFVFGRGGEEAIFLSERNIPYRVVPGVSSAVAVPELMGIPLTHRDISRGFHVYTGHVREGADKSYDYIRSCGGTGVFLMGLGGIGEIVDRLISDGADKHTPVSVISKGTLIGETRITGELCNICGMVRDKKIEAPAVIVVGDVAAYDLRYGDKGPLFGKQLGAVATGELMDRLRANIEEKGGNLFSVCRMRVEPYDDGVLEKELDGIADYSWIGFTSRNGIKIFFEKIRKKGIDYRSLSHIKFAVVGSGTREALADEGFQADIVPPEYTTESMAGKLCHAVKEGEKILVIRAREGSPKMSEIFEESGVSAVTVPIYGITGEKTENFDAADSLDGLIFASASGVRTFFGYLGDDKDISDWDKQRRRKGLAIGAIGVVTADELIKHGIEADVVPRISDSAHLIEAFSEKWRN